MPLRDWPGGTGVQFRTRKKVEKMKIIFDPNNTSDRKVVGEVLDRLNELADIGPVPGPEVNAEPEVKADPSIVRDGFVSRINIAHGCCPRK
jgi:hypothetical protein